MVDRNSMTHCVKSLVIVIAGFLLTGCMGEAVESTSPEDNATSVPRYSDVSVTFKVDMVASSITKDSFTLFDTSINDYVDAKVVYDAANKIATLVPTMPLSRLTQYEATLKETINTAGNADISEDFVWRFETANSPVQGALKTVAAAAVEVQGNYAFYVARLRRMVVVDLSVPEKPTLAAELPIDGPGWGIALNGNYAYVSNGIIQTVDITNPMAPVIVNTLDIDYRRADVDVYVGADQITVDGNYLYVSVENFGLWVIDISNPTAPALVGEYDVYPALGEERYYPTNLIKKGNYVYAFSEDNATVIYDVSTPTAPILAKIYSDYSAREWIFNGNIAYAINRNWLGVIDVTDPTNPVYLNDVLSDVSNSAFYDLLLEGDTLYVADMIVGRVLKYDVSNATSPVLVGSLSGMGQVKTLGMINADTLYTTGLLSGFFSIEKE